MCDYSQYLKNKMSLLTGLNQSNWSLNVCLALWQTVRVAVLVMVPAGISAGSLAPNRRVSF